MNHCIIMTAYKDAAMLNRFISSIPDDWGIYVHLDRKSELESKDIDSRADVISLKKIFWGGWEHLYVICRMLSAALSDKRRFDYFHIVSGQDYFCARPEDFDRILGSNRTNYIGCFSIPNWNWGWEGGTKIFQYRTLSSWCDVRFGCARFFNKSLYCLQKYFHLTKRLPDIPLYGGSVYSSLHRDFVEWLAQSPLASDMLKRLKHTTCAEEVYFQTMLMNSPYKDTISDDNPLRFAEWHCTPAPKFLDIEDLGNVLGSGDLFCRKTATGVSDELLDRIDESLALRRH